MPSEAEFKDVTQKVNAGLDDIEKDIARDGSLTEVEETTLMTDYKAVLARVQEIATRVGETIA